MASAALPLRQLLPLPPRVPTPAPPPAAALRTVPPRRRRTASLLRPRNSARALLLRLPLPALPTATSPAPPTSRPSSRRTSSSGTRAFLRQRPRSAVHPTATARVREAARQAPAPVPARVARAPPAAFRRRSCS